MMTNPSEARRTMPIGHPVWPAYAIHCLSTFQPDPALGETGLRSLLSMWKFYNRLTTEQVNRVIAYFTTDAPTVELGRVPAPYDSGTVRKGRSS